MINLQKYAIGKHPLDLPGHQPTKMRILQQLVEAGNAEEVVQWLDNADEDHNDEALEYASSQGNAVLARLLIQRGANIASRNFDETPLYIATTNDHPAVVEVLLESGADPDTIGWPRVRIDFSGPDTNPLGPDTVGAVAISNGYTNVLHQLLRYDMDVYVMTPSNHTFLDAALIHDDPGTSKIMVNLLVDRGIDFDIQDLYMLPSDDREQGREMINLDQVPSDIRHIIDTARQCQSLIYLSSLSDTEMNEQNIFGQTPLHRAAQNGQLEQVRYLIEQRGANPLLRDVFGRRPDESAQHRWDSFCDHENSWSSEDPSRCVFFYPDEIHDLMNRKHKKLQMCADIIQAFQEKYDEVQKYKILESASSYTKQVKGWARNLIGLPFDVFNHIRMFGLGTK